MRLTSHHTTDDQKTEEKTKQNKWSTNCFLPSKHHVTAPDFLLRKNSSKSFFLFKPCTAVKPMCSRPCRPFDSRSTVTAKKGPFRFYLLRRGTLLISESTICHVFTICPSVIAKKNNFTKIATVWWTNTTENCALQKVHFCKLDFYQKKWVVLACETHHHH